MGYNGGMLTYSAAKAMMDKAPDRGNGRRRRLANNTYLYQHSPDSYSIRYHYTDVVDINSDGTYTLRTGGWETSTTKERINNYAPSRVYSTKGTWCVHSADDPKTPAKVQKCRKCHGKKNVTSPDYWEKYGKLREPNYEVKTDLAWQTDANGRTNYDARALHIVGQVRRTDTGEWGTHRKPVYHHVQVHSCYNCNGTGIVDYGSKPNPIVFYDGITVDGNGNVTESSERRRLAESAAEIAEREREQAKQRKLARRAADKRFLAENGLKVVKGQVIVYKAVNAALWSNHGKQYNVGTVVVADDWRATDECGNGLHFSPTPEMARYYHIMNNYDDVIRYLACKVTARGMVILHDKVKARECRVLYEVDIDGNALTSGEASATR